LHWAALPDFLTRKNDSVASSDIATSAVRHGARTITHLFNAMPQLHHRDPTIIGLLGASPHVSSLSHLLPRPTAPPSNTGIAQGYAEAIDTTETPPQSPFYTRSATTPVSSSGIETPLLLPSRKGGGTEILGEVADKPFVRPFYGMIVDGIHSHPNSVRVSLILFKSTYDRQQNLILVAQLAYSAHPEGCILVTDGKSNEIQSCGFLSPVS
jgi:N-acetylglucosamine-6-phosphate deacetylase